MRTERIDKWVRAYFDGVAIVESRDPLLFWEEDFPVPSYAFAHSDVRTDLLTESHGEPPQKPSFFLPKGPVSQWYDVTVGRRTAPHAAWVRDAPELSDRLVLSWQPGLLDRWLEEDEQVAGHPRDPYKRVETLASSRHVVLRLGDLTLADSARPILLLETSLPTRYYLPREDVNLEALTPSSNRSHCPYKGIADQYWSVTGNPDAVDIAWSYSAPLPAVEKVAGRVAFYNELVDITVDGAPQPRPTSPFSAKEHRPTI
ncbi:MAG: hypothetical protein JWQ91_1690 [Aeromicrobium sp.]|jgi:uncharacterized protein (DUF427 family)|uniref:DUF427 domain-containing protein n=1 Tax=Aeromicrobium sp. TaxID=1871063 RepID=UPI00261E8874|nr:DUF427 domain-containing protein [Aeromicrobium sp.]MCW2768685.1 hypothetical protein [Aeromicrobium sp.]MCW2787796.1 hypothetical protein [Aeromicrobium sp.]MCW2824773.1 hypothetical protein [Aeromicrobium sp.]